MVNKIEIYYKIILYNIFKFDKWHIGSEKYRPYALEIIKFLNKKEVKNSVVEIGCGLGDLVRNIKFTHKKGLDISVKVIKAAKFISTFNNKVDFQQFDFLKEQLIGNYDVIILVNWIHDINPSLLKSKVETFYSMNLNKGGYIIMDSISQKGYPFEHDVKFLTQNLNCNIVLIGEFVNNRYVWAIIK